MSDIKFYKSISTIRNDEDKMQAEFFYWFRQAYSEVLAYSTPNGFKKSIYSAWLAKVTGLVSGVPDVFIAKASNGCNGLYLELKCEARSKLSLKGVNAGKMLKKPKGKLSDEQVAIIAKLESEGYKCVVCFGLNECKNAVMEYLGS